MQNQCTASSKRGALCGDSCSPQCVCMFPAVDHHVPCPAFATGAPSSLAQPHEATEDNLANATGTVNAGGGETRLLDLDSAAPTFIRGATDVFTILCQNVGLPTKVKVWHDNTGKHPDWFLVEIKARKKGCKDWVTFPCNR